MRSLRDIYHKKHELKGCFLWLLGQVKPWIWKILLVSILNAGLSVLGVLIAAINKWMIDYAVGEEPSFQPGIYALLVVATIFQMAFNSGVNIFRILMNEKFGFYMKKRFFGNILRGDWLKLSRFHSGDIMTRITGDMDTIANGLFTMIPSLFYIVFQFVTAFGVLFHYDHMLAVLAICLGPVGLMISIAMSRIFAAFQKRAMENEGAYRSFMQECVENVVIEKSFSMEEECARRMGGFWNVRYEILRKRGLIGFGMNMAVNLIFSGGYLAAFGWSLYRLVHGEITYGTVTLLLALVGQVQAPIQNLQSIAQQLIGIFVSARRVMEISDITAEDYESPCRIDGSLGLCALGVDFAYEEGRELIFQNMDLQIEPGETVGLIGPSGTGKTTMIRLILALVSPGRGSLILFDKKGQKCTPSPAVRRVISYVPQGNTLMSGTIRENLRVGNPEATEEEMWEALAVAEAADFVRELPGGLDTAILEKGGAVSEGQAQRIAIARAVIKPASLLILDEATASLDIETETRIVMNLKAMTKEMTKIVVTHRPSLLDICEETYRLEERRFVRVTSI